MTIGILGTGPMGRLLGAHWAQHKHSVCFGSSDVNAGRAVQLAQKVARKTKAGTYADAVAFGEVVLFAVAWERGIPVAQELAGALAGKIVIDCTNPPTLEDILALTPHTSQAEAIAAAAPGAHVVKAFNATAAEAIRVSKVDTFTIVDRPPVFYCGDDTEAGQVAHGLADQIGFQPVNAGPLKNARYLEAMGAFAVYLSESGSKFQLTAKNVRY
jgi:predicted dinucleotide-binding enzyme